MKRTIHARSSLFLIELMLAVLFFSLSSAVCVQMFAHAHQLSQSAHALQHAIQAADNAAELLQYDLTHASPYLPSAYPDAEILSEDSSALYREIHIFYNDSWKPCTRDQSAYQLTIQLQPEDNGLVAGVLHINAQEGDPAVYELSLYIFAGTEI